MRARRQKQFYVEADVVMLHSDEDGHLKRVERERGQLVYARGPIEAQERAVESWPSEAITVKTVLPVRNIRLARRMVEGDSYNPEWDYNQGMIEEAVEAMEPEE
jgi:hypothetical protein